MVDKVSTKELWANAAKDMPPPAPPAAGPQVPAPAVAADVHPADADYLPPVSTVKLPTRGLVYPPDSPLYLLESVDVKSVSAKEENILSSVVLIKKGIVLSTLMRACITNRLIDPDQMLPGDRNAILVAIRISAYGPAYSARVVCTECGEQGEADFDLTRLTLKTLDVEPAGGRGTNDFTFTLPVLKRVVHFRLLPAAAANQLDKDLEAIRKATGEERGVTMRLQAQVLSVQGVPEERLSKTLENLPARDARALRQYMDRIAPGVDMTHAYECESCGKTTEVEIPIGTGFFWPSDGE
jgi:hypothetical protein